MDADLQQRVSKADDRRIKAVRAMFARQRFSREQADVRGLTVIYTQIGYISMQVTESWEERLARVPHYVELFAGSRPAEHDVESFLERHRRGGDATRA